MDCSEIFVKGLTCLSTSEKLIRSLFILFQYPFILAEFRHWVGRGSSHNRLLELYMEEEDDKEKESVDKDSVHCIYLNFYKATLRSRKRNNTSDGVTLFL